MIRSRSSVGPAGSLYPAIVTLINSTVGVAALAMPYCFQQAHQKLRIVMLALLTVAITPLCLISRVQSLIRMSAFAMVFYTAMLLHVSYVVFTRW
ncbi:hypothetical protein FBUS_03859 [Fasciolopsis buskii]|uniref:Uncharacterized protein n=1 Tax=Fasciolopsis buskii TaxID=27845 RepID=A0A8E0VMQ1_9TREM|nr:hypothetical protein FBUS_03859 [Fasciolopsis buski]